MAEMYKSARSMSLASQVNDSVDYVVGPMLKDHFVAKDPRILLMATPTRIVTLKQAVWLERTGDIVLDEELFTACGEKDCVLHLEHRPTVSDPAAAMEDEGGDEEEVLALVQRHTTAVTLADLYRRGRAKGLLAGGSNYH